MPATIASFSDVHDLPHHVSLADDRLDLIPTDRERLRHASFIDGRTDFSTGPTRRTRLSDLLAATVPAPQPDRYIFHIAFCGSTLLSRLLDAEGHALVLREPNCLTDLANQRAALDAAERSDPASAPALHAVRALLRRRWREDEPIVVKPSNWVNNLAPLICEDAQNLRPLFLVMDRAAFVRAVFRGGSDRLAFTARAAVHLTSAGRANAELVAMALARDTDQLGKLAGLAAVAHEVQMRLFREAAAKGGWDAAHWLTLDELVADPRQAARKAASTLSIVLPDTALEANIAHWLGRHAKQPDLAYSAEAQERFDRDAEAEHGARIDEALRWAERAFAISD
jgi:hypothetical protein